MLAVAPTVRLPLVPGVIDKFELDALCKVGVVTLVVNVGSLLISILAMVVPVILMLLLPVLLRRLAMFVKLGALLPLLCSNWFALPAVVKA